LKCSNAPARSSRDVATSARLGVPTRPTYFRPYADAVGPGCVLAPSPTPGEVALRLKAGQVVAPRQPRCAGVHVLHARPACAACAAAGNPAGPGEALQPPCVRHAPRPPSHSPGRSSEPPHRARRRHRPKLAGVLRLPPPLLKSKHHTSPHPHPLHPPVHMQWPTNPPARRHCGHCGRPPPSSPPAVTGAVSGQTDPAK
jgi:hypothetical protein